MFNAGHVYGPKIIMDRDVVFVNLNYRLGPLGNKQYTNKFQHFYYLIYVKVF